MNHDALGLPLSWLPDETLFSLCSRYHVVAGSHRAAVTCEVLFGHRRQGCAHDFPAHLEHFSRVAGPYLGGVDAIVEQRTLLPLYLRFAVPSLAKAAISAAAQGSSGGLKFQLGLLTSRFRANHPLKACRACMVEDLASYATSYWHRDHQWPGVWVCLRHRSWLAASDLKSTGARRFHWVLPCASQLSAEVRTVPPFEAIKLAQTIAGAVRQQQFFSLLTLRKTFRTALCERGILAGPHNNRLDHSKAGRDYAAFIAPLTSIEQMAGLPTSDVAAAAEVARLIGPVRSGSHPIRYLTLAAWLFDDFEDFAARYVHACQEEPLPDERKAGSLDPITSAGDERKREFMRRVEAGASITGAARAVGVDPKTGIAWAAARGVSTPHRPKQLRDELRKRLIAVLRRGASKERVAALGSVSVQTITTLLRSHVGLHEAWKQAQFVNAQCRNRRLWTRSTQANPLSGVKAARLLQPAAYAWLYRNDRDWLNKQTDSMARATRAIKTPRVDWDARDRALAQAVKTAALQHIEAFPEAKLRLVNLCQRWPELKAKLSRLDRLPLTRAAIFGVLRRKPSDRSPLVTEWLFDTDA